MKKASLLLRKQIKLIQSRVCGDIEAERRAQDSIGKLESVVLAGKVKFVPQHRGVYSADFAIPNKLSPQRMVILYLHGGGYVAGSQEYARGFGGVLAEMTGHATLCVGYRLAPEFPYPAALDDCFDAYLFLHQAYPEHKITVVGESAGGGLCYALCLRARAAGIELPDKVVAISPWVDLTLSTPSHVKNADIDPSLTTEQLEMYANMYAPNDKANPLVSPLFGNLTELPPSLIFVGSHEILLDDAVLLAKKINNNGSTATIHIEDGAWHAYVLYGTYEAKQACHKIKTFIKAHIL